jgi:hypothetical protein
LCEDLAAKDTDATVDLRWGDEHCREDRVVRPAGNKSAHSLASGGRGKPKSLDGFCDSKAGEPDSAAACNSFALVNISNMLVFIL